MWNPPRHITNLFYEWNRVLLSNQQFRLFVIDRETCLEKKLGENTEIQAKASQFSRNELDGSPIHAFRQTDVFKVLISTLIALDGSHSTTRSKPGGRDKSGAAGRRRNFTTSTTIVPLCRRGEQRQQRQQRHQLARRNRGNEPFKEGTSLMHSLWWASQFDKLLNLPLPSGEQRTASIDSLIHQHTPQRKSHSFMKIRVRERRFINENVKLARTNTGSRCK